MRRDAFLRRKKELSPYEITYHHNSDRWKSVNFSILKTSEANWSSEIKFLSEDELNLNDEIKLLPNNSGGIYMFFIKGDTLPFFEKYLLYIGRAQHTSHENLRARVRSYYYEFFKEDARPKIADMIHTWGKNLVLHYIKLDTNEQIIEYEAKLINSILPPFNDEIPNLIPKEPEPAF